MDHPDLSSLEHNDERLDELLTKKFDAKAKLTEISVNNFIKRHIVMAAPFPVTAPSSVQNLMNSSSRRFDGKSKSLDDRD